MPSQLRQLVSAALIASFLAGAPSTGAQSVADRAAANQVLGCVVDVSVPSPPARASEGGFAFEFESLGGTALDGRTCAVYRLRNLPGSPPTPVRWSAGNEVLITITGLARCRGDLPCEWLEVARYFEGDVVSGDTLLGYGLNADSFVASSDALVGFPSPDVQASAASVGTELVGTLVDPEGGLVSLDLVVKSRLERDGDLITLVYEATASDPSQLDGSRFVLYWEALDEVAVDHQGEGGLFRSSLRGTVVPAVREDGVVSVRMTAASAVFRDGLTLEVREPEMSGRTLLTVTLPAFLPGR